MANKLYSVTNSYVYNIPGLWEEVRIPQHAEEPWHTEGSADLFNDPWKRLGYAVTVMAVIDYLEAWKASNTGKYVPYENRMPVIKKEFFETSDERAQLLNDIREHVILKGSTAVNNCIQRLKQELGWLKNKKGA